MSGTRKEEMLSGFPFSFSITIPWPLHDVRERINDLVAKGIDKRKKKLAVIPQAGE